jgi:hypothetical protein
MMEKTEVGGLSHCEKFNKLYSPYSSAINLAFKSNSPKLISAQFSYRPNAST